MKIESEDTNILNLLSGRFYFIPRFQRPFSWEADQINQFWVDLIDNQQGDYFIGSMVLFRKGEQTFGIVDGQQRLTTIAILLCVIRNAFAEIGEKQLAQGVQNLIERPNIENENTFVLKTETSFPYFQDAILSDGDPKLQHKSGVEEKSLAQCFKILTDKVNSVLISVNADATVPEAKKQAEKVAKLKALRGNLLGLKLIRIALDGEDDAYVIFETLNTRGKDLELSDLLKNHFTRLLKKKNDVDVAKEKWDAVLRVLSESQVDVATDTFISHFWASRYEALPVRNLFPSVKKAISKDNATAYLDYFVSDAKLYRSIIEPSYGWSKNDAAIRESLKALQIFRVVQPMPAVLSVIRSYKDGIIKQKKAAAALSAIENFHFAFTAVTSSRSSGGISFMYSAFARKLFECADSQGASDQIDELILKLRDRRPIYQEFLVGFEQIQFTNFLTKQKSLVRYMLKRFAEHEKLAFTSDWDELSLEHVHPQDKISGEWNAEIVGQIGNLIFATHEVNCKLDNKSFDKKKPILLAERSSVPKFVLEQSEWTPDQVSEHNEILAELAYDKIWAI